MVRPGVVHTRMTEGMTDPRPAATTAAVGTAVAAAVRAGCPQVYVPRALGPRAAIMAVPPRPVWRWVAARG